ncbi:hypothetical protein J3F83DRAFT_747458 [Trichoderma novae-zelandiae]
MYLHIRCLSIFMLFFSSCQDTATSGAEIGQQAERDNKSMDTFHPSPPFQTIHQSILDMTDACHDWLAIAEGGTIVSAARRQPDQPPENDGLAAPVASPRLLQVDLVLCIVVDTSPSKSYE